MRQITARMTTVAALAGLMLLATPSQPQAQSWPQRPVRLIVPFGPGAGADIGARLLSERLPARWGGKPVVIENRPGGDGLVAIQSFLSANDDHTFLFTPAGNFTVHPAAMNIGTVAEFVARAKAEPGKFNAAVVPGITEFTFDYFVKTAGLTLTKVPYRDIVQAATDVGEGRLQIYMASYAILQPQTEAGRIKTIVVNGRERAPILPNIPTAREVAAALDEDALRQLLEVEGLVGLFGSRTLPKELVEKIGADVVAATKDPAVSARLSATAQTVNPGMPAEFAAAIQAQRDQIAKIAQELGIKPKVQP